MGKGVLIVISGPSGSGKGTVVERICDLAPEHVVSVSSTTRGPRDGEVHGVHYNFIDRAEFESYIANDMMLEYTVYCDNYYGTPKKAVYDYLEEGRNVILEIEVDGATQVKERYPDAILIMLVPPTYASLEARLRGRKDPVPEEVIRKRLNKAKVELEQLDKYGYLVVNYDNASEKAAQDILEIVSVEKRKTVYHKNFKDEFYA